MINYNKLWNMLDKKNIPQEKFRSDLHIPSNVFTRMKNNETIHMSTIDKICDAFNCGVNDVIVYQRAKTEYYTID
jgi:DNA-binding Xre family transcriptional regulator